MHRVNTLKHSKRPYLADGGLETALIFHYGLDLPHFAAFPLLESDEGRRILRQYFSDFMEVARRAGAGFVFDLPTWRANAGWGKTLGRNDDAIRAANHAAVEFGNALREEWEDARMPIVLNGVIGPTGNGYAVGEALLPDRATELHSVQIGALADAGADIVSAMTMTHSGEAIGVARAADESGLPSIIGFTVETDGNLPSGESIGEAIAAIDDATGGAPLGFMINCAHPTHFMHLLEGAWTGRIAEIRANASRLSHAELDEATELDDGDPSEFGALYGTLRELLPNLRVIGGCCGTDQRHVERAARHFHGFSGA